MPWPFSRKKREQAEAERSGPRAPRPAGADEALTKEILGWLQANHPTLAARRAEPAAAIIHVGAPPVATASGGAAPAGAVLKVKRGKLSWVDLYDPVLRDVVNALVKDLDKQQKWSFNGVISTRYEART